MGVINKLMDWYISQVDGEWEHEYGVRIYTLDNPGWAVEIDYWATEIDGYISPLQLFEISDDDWYSYRFEDDKYLGMGDPSKLELIIATFLNIKDKVLKDREKSL